MLGLQKIFLLVRFFNWISCNKDLKAKISRLFTCFFCLTPWGWNVLGVGRPLRSWRLGWRNTKICIHGASRMERKRGKCWKLPIFELFFILALFTTCFYQFLFWKYLNFSMTRLLSDILFPFPNSNDLNSLAYASRILHFTYTLQSIQ